MSNPQFPDIHVTVTWTATLDENGNVTSDTFAFDQDPIMLPYNGASPANRYWVYWDLVAQDQNGNTLSSADFKATHGVQPGYPGTWGQPAETPGKPTEYRLSMNNQNTTGHNQTYPYTATVTYNDDDYTSDPEITFEPMGGGG